MWLLHRVLLAFPQPPMSITSPVPQWHLSDPGLSLFRDFNQQKPLVFFRIGNNVL